MSASVKLRYGPEGWSSINPEERSILTANRVNVQNQKFKKELAVKQRGIEDEMKCDNILFSRKESVMQNRLSRLTKASDNFCGRLGTPFSSASSDNWITKQGRPPSQQEQGSNTSHNSNSLTSSTWKNKENSSKSKSNNGEWPSTSRPNSEQKTRRVHFGQETKPSVDNIVTNVIKEAQNVLTPRRHSVPGDLGTYREDHDTASTSMSIQLPNISKTGSTKQLTSRSSNSLKKSSHGFSSSSLGHGFSNLTPRNSLKAVSGLEEEMARWRRLHHTRAVNARIKAVRSGGKRHSSCVTLRETMDHAAMLRREEAIHPEPFTAEKAWGLLNCGYLRLTQSNISTLEDMCSAAGYDISSHPHRSTEDAANDMQAVFEQLRENRRLQPDVTSQLKFRQSLLFKRLSEGLFTHI